jgi:hypothetical protein
VQQNTIKQNEHMNAPLVQQKKKKQSGCWKCSFISQNVITIDKRPKKKGSNANLWIYHQKQKQ